MPINILKDLLCYLKDSNIPIPAYTSLQTLIGNILTEEEQRLGTIINEHLPQYAKKIIANLLTTDEGLYAIPALKADPKGFKTRELQGELDKYHKCKHLFTACKVILPKFNISKNNINYYDAHRLLTLSKDRSQLYIICFIYKQFHKINNNLIDGFIHYVRTYDRKAEEYAKEEIYQTKSIITQYQPQVGKILDLFGNKDLNNYKFKAIKQQVFKFVSEDVIKKISKFIRRDKVDKKEFLWDFHKKNHYAATTNLRPLFMAIDFSYPEISVDLQLAVQFMRTAFTANKLLSTFRVRDFPIKFIRKEIQQYFFMRKIFQNKSRKTCKVIDPSKYEYLIYQQIEQGIHAGEVYANTSIEYKSLDADLAFEKNLKQQKKIIQNAHIPALTDDIKGKLNELKNVLENMLIEVNQRINSGENSYVKIKKKGSSTRWTLPYQKIKPDFNNPFYDKLPQINIIDLLVFVDTQCNFTNAFGHIKTYESQRTVDYGYILACILANAQGIGIAKMAECSKLNYDKLLKIHNSRIRLETLEEANNVLCKAIEKMPIFKYYNIQEDKLHGAADGRKVDVRRQTFKSRYLRKYFKEKGVSSYTLLVNNIAIDSKIITGHESHFLFDRLLNNTSQIRPNIMSTDNEGSNQLNHILLDLINVIFAPHYKTITKKARSIRTFIDPKHYNNYLIKPYIKINEDLIIDEWPNMQNIFISLLSGENSQSTIVSKLSSHKRKNKTKDALWEYNNIFMSIYLLWYINDVELRRYVRKGLNRIEGFHQLVRAITSVGGGDFRGQNELEMSLWNECTRLVANTIIYYNAYLLSQILIKKGDNLTEKEKNLLRRISPIAWQFINFLGNYDFSFKNNMNIEEMLHIMAKYFDEEILKGK
jgi:TnpA family transposase